MPLTNRERRAKLAALVTIEGFNDAEALLKAVAHDSVCPGICTEPSCDYTAEVEPDQDRGFCEECRTQTVQSALTLAGLI